MHHPHRKGSWRGANSNDWEPSRCLGSGMCLICGILCANKPLSASSGYVYDSYNYKSFPPPLSLLLVVEVGTPHISNKLVCVCVCVCVCVRACVFCRHVLSVLANKHWTGKQITVSKTRPVLLNALYVYYNVKIKVTDEFECFQCYKLGRNVFRPPTKKYKFCYVVSVLFFLTKSVQLTQSGQVVSGWLSPQLPNVLELNLVSHVSTKTRLANWILVHISINLILFLVMLWNRKEPFFVRKILGF